ncbi:5,10-methylenetetrahydrofolate reductase [Candidatus Bathyarchaeota archaeon]|nr:5,10-methylenetetrahydrofolate reductase [Candidatus Bathyarchaeota archaeon]
MIITTKKPITEIIELVKDSEKLFIAGCGSCSTVCLTGGENQVSEMAEILEGKKPYSFQEPVEEEYVDKKGRTKTKTIMVDREETVKEPHVITGTIVLEEPCDRRLDTKELPKADGINEADAVIVMSCGVGMQTVYETLIKAKERGKIQKMPMVFVSNDTHFIGQTQRIGVFTELCRGCGDCMLNETGGICPVVRCGKGLMNGPCGGMIDGKCEVKDYTLDCGWALVYQRLKLLDELRAYEKIREPRDYARFYATRDVNNR